MLKHFLSGLLYPLSLLLFVDGCCFDMWVCAQLMCSFVAIILVLVLLLSYFVKWMVLTGYLRKCFSLSLLYMLSVHRCVVYILSVHRCVGLGDWQRYAYPLRIRVYMSRERSKISQKRLASGICNKCWRYSCPDAAPAPHGESIKMNLAPKAPLLSYVYLHFATYEAFFTKQIIHCYTGD